MGLATRHQRNVRRQSPIVGTYLRDTLGTSHPMARCISTVPWRNTSSRTGPVTGDGAGTRPRAVSSWTTPRRCGPGDGHVQIVQARTGLRHDLGRVRDQNRVELKPSYLLDAEHDRPVQGQLLQHHVRDATPTARVSSSRRSAGTMTARLPEPITADSSWVSSPSKDPSPPGGA